MKQSKIEGAIALVTGANRGIGRALSEALLSRGVKKLYAAARESEALNELRDARVVPLLLDVTDAKQIRAAGAAAQDVTLLFNNAGVTLNAEIWSAAAFEQARREMEVNYFGPLQMLREFAPILGKNGGGAWITVGSAAGLSNVPMFPTYSASKAALHSLTQCARVLLAAQGSAVFGAYPGPVDTDMVRELAMPKAPARDVANAILDGMESGQEDIFPDSFSRDFGRQFESSPKAAERRVAAMVAAMAAGSAA